MRTYLIRGDQAIVRRTCPARLDAGDLAVTTAEQLRDSRLTAKQLVAIHNGLPGVVILPKAPHRKAAIDRLWTALEQLPVSRRASADPAPAARPASKQATVIALLSRAEGATLEALIAATGWQRHTVRGVIAGALKKKRGLAIVSEKATDGTRVYRIDGDGAARA
jgi:hypothetical protein